MTAEIDWNEVSPGDQVWVSSRSDPHARGIFLTVKAVERDPLSGIVELHSPGLIVSLDEWMVAYLDKTSLLPQDDGIYLGELSGTPYLFRRIKDQWTVTQLSWGNPNVKDMVAAAGSMTQLIEKPKK